MTTAATSNRNPDCVTGPLADAAQIAAVVVEQESRAEGMVPIDVTEALGSLPITIPQQGVGEAEAIERLRRVVIATPTTSGTRFFNQLFAGRERIATIAEALTVVLNQSMYTYKVAGPQVLIEREVLERLLAKASMTGGDAMFTPGGSLSNLAAMIVARNEMIPGAKEQGIDGRKHTIYTSAESHYSIRKNAGMIGVGRENVRKVAIDAHGRMDPAALTSMIKADRADNKSPMMIISTSGTTVMGAFDQIEPISEIAQQEKIWLHVDGAFGGSALMHPKHRDLLAGLDRADSFTWDAHKMMGVPLICSVALTRKPGLFREHFDETASYLYQQDFEQDHAWLNPGTRSLQCGRRNDALKLWALWQSLGDDGFAQRIEKQHALARHAVGIIKSNDQLKLSFDPAWVNVCFEVAGKSTEAICDRLNTLGTLKIGHGVVFGRRVIRLVTIDPQIDERDIDRLFRDILAVAANVEAADNIVD